MMVSETFAVPERSTASKSGKRVSKSVTPESVTCVSREANRLQPTQMSEVQDTGVSDANTP